MHVDLTVTLGNIVTAGAVLGAIIRFEMVARTIHKFLVEHEMLIGDYAKRNGIKVSDLPTRQRH